MKITPNFELSEFGQVPDSIDLYLFKNWVRKDLQTLRNRYGRIVITSGYRSVEHNQVVGGVANSQHIWTDKHFAIDFVPTETDIDIVFGYMKANIEYDQLIRERKKGKDWIHVSVSYTPRKQILWKMM